MTTHLTPEQLLDVAERTRRPAEFPHLSSCAACERRVSELRDTIAAAADVEVPEPSPLYWDHLSARVHQAVAEEEIGGAAVRWRRWTAWRFTVPAAAVAMLVVLVAGTLNRRGVPPGPSEPVSTAVEQTPVEAIVPFDDDPALVLLADLSSGLDWDTASEAGLMPSHGTVDKVVLALEPEDRLELQRILQEGLSEGGA